MFKANKTETLTKVIKKVVPTILFDKRVLAHMQVYIEHCMDEVGWLCAAKRLDSGEIHIYDVFLFQQEVHGATTEISPEGLATFGMDLLTQENGMELFNDIRAWGHSHVHMACNPSGQDDLQMKKFGDTGADWFVRIIGNKKGDMRIDVYDYARGIEFHHCDWEVVESQEIQDVYDEIERLYKLIDDANKNFKAQFEEEIKAEMAIKVKKMWANRNYGTHHNYKPYGVQQTPGKHLEQVPPRTSESPNAANGTNSSASGTDMHPKTHGSSGESATKSGGTTTREESYHSFFKHADFIDMAAMSSPLELDEWLFTQYNANLDREDITHLYYYCKAYAFKFNNQGVNV